jgi:tripartite-type tricarboxylate transporter receptor subunit TctC
MVPDTVKTVADFIAWARANPKQAAFSSSAAGATPHFAGMMFARAAGIDLLHVPYKGGAPAMQDMMGGQIASGFPGVGEALPMLGPRLRVLATTGAQRSRFMPDVPTMAESGYKDVVAEVWVGVFMPPKTPAAIVNHAADAINASLATPETREVFGKFAMETIPGTSASFAARIAADLAAWGPIIQASGFSAED